MKVITLIFTGVRGSYVTGPNGNCIFLPFAGIRYDGDLRYEGYFGSFWSGTCNDVRYDDYNGLDAYYLDCCEDYVIWDNYYLYHGHSVRPVTEK